MGLALVSQHPALLPDLSVAENLLLVRRASEWPDRSGRAAWAREVLGGMRLDLPVDKPVTDLPIADRALIQIARALSLKPKVLILDEPTEPLNEGQIGLLFAKVRELAANGCAIVYISHRIPEIMQISDRVTALRNGRLGGATVRTDTVDEQAIISMIIGRETAVREVVKSSPATVGREPLVEISGLTRTPALAPTSTTIWPGEIVGLAGIGGSGQETFIRGLAGLSPCQGEVRIAGRRTRLRNPADARAAGIAYVPGDRQAEGVFSTLTVARNIGLGGLGKNASGGVISPGRERRSVASAIDALRIRTSGSEAAVSSLSGGNQQKIVLARALETKPKVLLADEPTSGIDVGSRSEIYEILRRSADDGVAVVVLSTDAPELETLCDRILVFSRGHVISELTGDQVRSSRISEELLMSTQLRRDDRPSREPAWYRRLTGQLSGQYAGIAGLLALIVVLGIIGSAYNQRFLNPVNISAILLAWAGLASVSFGQQFAILLGGIDLSVGPLTGLIAVVGSFFAARVSDYGSLLLGLVFMLLAAVATGAFHFLLIWKFRVSAVGATLATYVAIQGISLVLRPSPAGTVDQSLINVISYQLGWLPVAALAVLILGLLLEYWLRFSRLGTEVRAVGSSPVIAQVLGVRSRRVTGTAFIACTTLTFIGGLLLLIGSGIGDATQGIEYTLNSVVAVVLGGAALAGGRGSFVGVMIGALLLEQSVSLASFLQLNQAWNSWAPGLLLVLAGLVFTAVHSGIRTGRRGAEVAI
jgi:ribose transport system ATP-binding protein